MNNNKLAIILKVFSVLSFAIMDVLVKKLSSDFPIFQIIFFRCLFGLIPVSFMLYYTQSPLKTKKINLHIYRALFAAFAMFVFFKSFQILPLAEVSSISFANILITTILAIFFLKEIVGIRRWTAIIVGFIGIIIILRPGTGLFNFYMLLPLIGATALSFTLIIVKNLLKYDSPPTCSFYMHFIIAIFMLIIIPFNWEIPSLKNLILLILMGIMGGIAQILLTNSFKLSNISILMPFDYTSIIWAMTFGIIFFSDYPDLYVIFGSCLIALSTYYIIYREIKFGQNINISKLNSRQI